MTNSQYNNSINEYLETPLNWPTQEWFLSISPIKSYVIQDFLQEYQYCFDFNTMEEFSQLDNCKTIDRAYSRMHDLFVLNTGMTPTEFNNFYAWVQDYNKTAYTDLLDALHFGSLGQEGVEGWLSTDFDSIDLSDIMSHGLEQSFAICFIGETRVDWRHVQNPKWSTIVSNALAYAIKHHGYNQNK
jgi:hypothetical protein|tara:strand:- start:455 stop:1012 length:558 start_codon:yes stop_codon:yes gene_type:complete